MDVLGAYAVCAHWRCLWFRPGMLGRGLSTGPQPALPRTTLVTCATALDPSTCPVRPTVPILFPSPWVERRKTRIIISPREIGGGVTWAGGEQLVEQHGDLHGTR